jgi:hypothetical protein
MILKISSESATEIVALIRLCPRLVTKHFPIPYCSGPCSVRGHACDIVIKEAGLFFTSY